MQLTTEQLALRSVIAIKAILENPDPDPTKQQEKIDSWCAQEATWVIENAKPAKKITDLYRPNRYVPLEEMPITGLYEPREEESTYAY